MIKLKINVLIHEFSYLLLLKFIKKKDSKQSGKIFDTKKYILLKIQKSQHEHL